MQESEFHLFERVFNRLCAGFNTPPTDVRRDAYWRSLRKLAVLEVAGLVDMALAESTFTSMPTVGQLWELHRKNSEPYAPAIPMKSGPSIQEQLCAYAAIRLHGSLPPNDFSHPWTYVYREGSAEGKRTAECIGVVVEAGGKKTGFSTSAMLADLEGHAKALRSFQPGPLPSHAQVAAHRQLVSA